MISMRSLIVKTHRDKNISTGDKLYYGMLGEVILKLAWRQKRNALAYARRVKIRYIRLKNWSENVSKPLPVGKETLINN